MKYIAEKKKCVQFVFSLVVGLIMIIGATDLKIKTTAPSAFGVNIIKRTTLKINFLH